MTTRFFSLSGRLLGLSLCLAPALAAQQAADTALALAVQAALESDVRDVPASSAEQESLLLLREDLGVARDVSSALAARGLQGTVVSCHSGVVELRGTVADGRQAAAAAQLAEQLAAGRSVSNRLRYPGQPAAAAESAPLLAAQPANLPRSTSESQPAVITGLRFLTTDGLAGRGISVEVLDGRVTFTGEVNSEAAQRYVSVAAQRIAGLRSVRNDLRLRPEDDEAERRLTLLVQRQIEQSALVQDVAPAILVSCRKGIIRLEGRVRDVAQREEALRLAAETRTVMAVDDQLAVDARLVVHERRFGQRLPPRAAP
ncbi:MAG: BON domain-containing protein [Planctomycetota bacterium]